MQMTPYPITPITPLYHNFISKRETFPENLAKIRHDDVKLRHMTSFSYIFPYYDVITLSADVSKSSEMTELTCIFFERSYSTL